MASVLEFEPLFQETVGTIRARLDADANAGLLPGDPRWIDTREGSFFWDVTQPLVLEFARVYDALATEVPAAAFASFAWGVYLDYHAEIFGLERKAAVAATGTVHFIGDPGTPVGEGAIAATDIDADGNSIEFATTEAGITGAQLTAPTGLGATPAGTGGTLPAGTYYYAVTAVNAFGETLPSAQVAAVTTGSTSEVALDWDDVAGATSYRVYRSTVSGDFGGLVYSGATSAYLDINATAPGLDAPEINGTSGVALAVEAIEEGTEGNVGAFAVVDTGSPLPGIDYLENPAAMTGGTEVELDEDLRERIVLEYEGRGDGLINDYRRWALEEPGVGRVSVVPVWDGPGTVLVVVMTSTGDPVATSVIDSLQERLDPTVGTADGLAPPGVTVTVDTPAVITSDFEAVLEFEDGYSLDGGGGTIALRSPVEEALSNYVNELDVGEDVRYHKIVAQLFTVRGIKDYTGTPQLNGGTADLAVGISPPEVAQLGTVTLS